MFPSALYFESAEGFGEWRILISTRADRDLRDARRRDKKFFTIIVKKIKWVGLHRQSRTFLRYSIIRELSNGHFSDDNQKWLSGPQTEIPIYEAKMTGDSRLIVRSMIERTENINAQFVFSIKLIVSPNTTPTLVLTRHSVLYAHLRCVHRLSDRW
jgi:hypothetical protein